MKRAGVRTGFAAVLLLAGACGPAEEVKVQELPPATLPSKERRIGLPEVEGVWRFAGWELPARDTAATGEGRVPPGDLRVSTQRMDSVAGAYVRNGASFPFLGEVRRDSILSVVVFDAAGAGSFLAGRVRRDTLWVELASLPSAQGWSAGTRAALVRGRVGAPFTRFRGVAPRPDTVRPDTAAADTARPAAPPPAGTGAPVPQPAAPPVQAAPRPTPPPTQQPTPATPQPTRPAPQQRPPARTQPEPQPPVRRDTPAPTPPRPDTPRRRPAPRDTQPRIPPVILPDTTPVLRPPPVA